MCGICGVLGAPDDVRRMASRLAHRGPDDEGFLGNTLGFRRLAIIDLETGAQPMKGCGDCWIVFNGEIYNYRELRTRLDHPFRTQSDTEVILHLYEEKGPACVHDLEGMFAFVIWDAKAGTLFAARDRTGKKPFYYRHSGDHFVFASELAAFEGPRRLDRASLAPYLAFGYVPPPATMLEGVRKLPPAHTLTFDGASVHLERYWEPRVEPVERSEDEYAERILHALTRAVRRRLVADVPLGAFLSGGIDSSIVAGLMSQIRSAQTFSIGFREERFDETAYARAAARHFRTEHRDEEVRPNAVEVLPLLVERFGEPFADSSCIPTYYLAKMTAQHVKVALSGDGGDELFAGYLRHEAMARMAGLKRLPSLLPWTASQLLRPWRSSGGRRLRRMLARPGRPLETLYAELMTTFDASMRSELGLEERVEGYLEERFAPLAGDPLAAAGYTDLLTYLPNDILTKVDIASMACSLEVRCPFLDTEVIELALKIPSELRRGKRVLKRAFRGLLPREIHDRGKMGFGVPLEAWFRGELREMLQDAMGSLERRGVFRPEGIRRFVSEHLEGRADHRDRLWSLLVFELWAQRFL